MGMLKGKTAIKLIKSFPALKSPVGETIFGAGDIAYVSMETVEEDTY